MIDAYSHNQKFGEVCPANWEEGKDAMKESRDGVADYLANPNATLNLQQIL